MSDAIEIETFTLGQNLHGPWIKCLRCGQVSYHPGDAENRYCGHCHVFHEDILPADRAAWLESF